MPEVIHPPDEPLLVARALRAYGRTDVDHREATVQELAGRSYVILPRTERQPVVFSIAYDGQLRRLRDRVPPELRFGYDQEDDDE